MKKYMKRIASWICMMLLAISMAVPVMAEGNNAVVNPSPSTGKVVSNEIEVTGVKIDPGKYVYNLGTGKISWYIPYKSEMTKDQVNNTIQSCSITLKKNDGTNVTLELKGRAQEGTSYKFYMGTTFLSDPSLSQLSEGTYEAVSARLNFKDGTFSYSNVADFTEHKENIKLELVSEIASVEGSTPSFKDSTGASVDASDVGVRVQQQEDSTYNDVVKNSGFSLSDVKSTSCFDIRLTSKTTGNYLTMTNGKINVRVPVSNPNYTPSKYAVTVYHIITNADGSPKAVVVPATWPENAGYIEITADSFSPYVVVYKKSGTIDNPVNPVQPVNPADPANPTDTDDDDDDDDTPTVVASQNNSNNTTGSSNSTSATGTTDVTNKAPKTGDKAPLAALLFVMTCGGAICAVSVKKMIAR